MYYSSKKTNEAFLYCTYYFLRFGFIETEFCETLHLSGDSVFKKNGNFLTLHFFLLIENPLVTYCCFRTALAESELEYNEKHVSTAVYLRLPISHKPSSLQQLTGRSHIVIVHLILDEKKTIECLTSWMLLLLSSCGYSACRAVLTIQLISFLG